MKRKSGVANMKHRPLYKQLLGIASFCVTILMLSESGLAAVEIQETETPLDQWQRQCELVSTALESAEFERAIVLAENVMGIATNIFGPFDSQVRKSEMLLIGAYIYGDRYQSAEMLIDAAIDKWTTLLGLDHSTIVFFNVSKVRCLLALGKVQEARSFGDSALVELKEAYGDDAEAVFRLATGLTHEWGGQRPYEELIYYCEQVYQYVLNRRRVDLPNLIEAGQVLAIAYVKAGNYSDAISTARDVVERVESEDNGSPDTYLFVHSAKHMLAQIYSVLGEYSEARSIIESTNSDNLPADALGAKSDSRLFLASIYAEMGLPNLAETQIQSVVPVEELMEDAQSEVGFDDLMEDAGALQNMVMSHVWGRIHLIRNDLEAAESELMESYEIAESGEKDQESLDYPSVLRDLSLLRVKQNRHQEALELSSQALSYIEDIFGSNHVVYGRFLGGRAEVLAEVGRYSEAKDCYQEQIRIFSSSLGEDSELSKSAVAAYDRLLLDGEIEQGEVARPPEP